MNFVAKMNRFALGACRVPRCGIDRGLCAGLSDQADTTYPTLGAAARQRHHCAPQQHVVVRKGNLKPN